jgi:hypothetical protein
MIWCFRKVKKMNCLNGFELEYDREIVTANEGLRRVLLVALL